MVGKSLLGDYFTAIIMLIVAFRLESTRPINKSFQGKQKMVLYFQLILCMFTMIFVNYGKAESFRLNGFASFGISYVELEDLELVPPYSLISDSSEVHLQGKYKDSIMVMRHTKLGLNYFFPINSWVDFRVQVVGRGVDPWSSYFNLDWAYLLIQLSESSSLSVGRHLFPFWKDSKYTGVQTSITLSNPDLRKTNPFKFIDGISYNYETEIGDEAYLFYTLGAGVGTLSVAEETKVSKVATSESKSFSFFMSSRLEWDDVYWHTHISYNIAKSKSTITEDRQISALGISSAVEWDDSFWFFESEGSFSKSLDSEEKRVKWATEALTGLENDLNNTEKLGSRMLEAQLSYAKVDGAAFQALLGIKPYENLMPYIGYSFQRSIGVERRSQFGDVDLTPYGIEFTSSLYTLDVDSFFTGLIHNVTENWVLKFNYFYKRFHHPQFKNGERNPDYTKNGFLPQLWKFVPKNESVHIFSLIMGVVF